jgi:CCR4-NOT transcriptional regulation complex NOT5 subunit
MMAEQQAQAEQEEAQKKQEQQQMVETFTQALAKVLPGAVAPPVAPATPSDFQNRVTSFVNAPDQEPPEQQTVVPPELRDEVHEGTGSGPKAPGPDMGPELDDASVLFGDIDLGAEREWAIQTERDI